MPLFPALGDTYDIKNIFHGLNMKKQKYFEYAKKPEPWQISHRALTDFSQTNSFTKDDLLNEWMNDEDVCRTAPATPGLLNMTDMQMSQSREPGFLWRTHYQ